MTQQEYESLLDNPIEAKRFVPPSNAVLFLQVFLGVALFFVIALAWGAVP